jgi:DNA-directed RNA polymerase subunit RPC12/RpoP
MSENETYGFNAIVALTAVECPACGYAEVAEQVADEYQCADCLTRYRGVEAEVHGPGDDPRDAGATVNDIY